VNAKIFPAPLTMVLLEVKEAVFDDKPMTRLTFFSKGKRGKLVIFLEPEDAKARNLKVGQPYDLEL